MDLSLFLPLIAMLPAQWSDVFHALVMFLGSMTVLVSTLRAVVIPALEKLAIWSGAKWDNKAVSVIKTSFEWVDTRLKPILQVLAAHKSPSALKPTPPPVSP